VRILFIYPECENLGVEYLSAVLKKAGHDTALAFDPRLFQTYYLDLNFLSRCFDFKHSILKKIRAFKPELICFSVFSDYYNWACDIASTIKKSFGIPIVFGGIHPTSVPENVISEFFVDYVCVGEGEGPLLELCEKISRKESTLEIANIWAKFGGKVFPNPVRPLFEKLDDLPFPDKKLFYSEFKGFSDIYTVISGRGCPYGCLYCHNNHLRHLYENKGSYLRRRSVENVIEELKAAKEKHGIKRVAFFDDTFIYDADWLERFAQAYRRDIHLPYFCHIHPNFVTKKTVACLSDSGCSSVTMGIQTTNERIRQEILNRKETNDSIVRAIQLLKETNIFVYTNMILGLPFQTEADIVEDIRFLNRHRVDMPASNWLRYYPKTEILAFAQKSGILCENDVKTIESSRKYMPYSKKGNTFNADFAKMRNLLSISHLVPTPVMEWILSRRLYRFFPSLSWRFSVSALAAMYKHRLKRKIAPYTYLTPRDVLFFYLVYIWRKSQLTLQRLMG
jgi:radical SAM superfamily enzyme YgiQ (UPF0313 family)